MKTILLVDDSRIDRMFIRNALAEVLPDCQCIEADSGKACIDIIKRENPILTILDIRMPEIDGFQVLERIRKDHETANHTVVMLSGSDRRDDINKAVSLVANDYYVKPSDRKGYRYVAKEISRRFELS